jgi:hypothetical protein
MRASFTAITLLLAASSALAQDVTRPLARGDRFVQTTTGYSWYSPRGERFGIVTDRRVILTGIALEKIISSSRRLTFARTIEWVPLI